MITGRLRERVIFTIRKSSTFPVIDAESHLWCDRLERELAETGVTMIALHRRNRTKLTRDGPILRRYRHHWKFGGCLGASRIFSGWSRVSPAWYLACGLILLRHL
jgi:hypothetical protein